MNDLEGHTLQKPSRQDEQRAEAAHTLEDVRLAALARSRVAVPAPALLVVKPPGR